MADKLYVEIGGDIKDLQKSLDEATKEMKSFRDETKKSFEKAAESSKGLQAQIGASGEAVAELNKYTAGLGGGWIKVAKAAKVGGAAMKSALIASGIGLFLAILSDVVENWDDIKGAIDGSTKALREHKREMEAVSRELERQKGLQDDNKRFIEIATELAVLKAKEAKASEEEIYNIEQDGRRKILADAQLRVDKYGEIVRNGVGLTQKVLDAAIKEEEKARRTAANVNLEITRAEYAERARIAAQPAAPKALLEQQQWVKDALVNHRDEVFTLNEEIQEAMTIRPMVSEEQLLWAANLIAMQTALEEFNQSASDIINGSIADTFIGLGQVIGDALANGGNVIQAAGSVLLSGVASMLGQLGELAIAAGVALLGIQTALKTLNPWVAIAAGVALVALASVVGSKAQAIGSGSGVSTLSGSGSGGGGGSSTAGVSGASAGSTRSSASNNSGGGSGGGTYVFEIAGTKLIGVLKNTLDRNKALGGSSLSFG